MRVGGAAVGSLADFGLGPLDLAASHDVTNVLQALMDRLQHSQSEMGKVGCAHTAAARCVGCSRCAQ
jgi:hypothetical protein